MTANELYDALIKHNYTTERPNYFKDLTHFEQGQIDMENTIMRQIHAFIKKESIC